MRGSYEVHTRLGRDADRVRAFEAGAVAKAGAAAAKAEAKRGRKAAALEGTLGGETVTETAAARAAAKATKADAAAHAAALLAGSSGAGASFEDGADSDPLFKMAFRTLVGRRQAAQAERLELLRSGGDGGGRGDNEIQAQSPAHNSVPQNSRQKAWWAD